MEIRRGRGEHWVCNGRKVDLVNWDKDQRERGVSLKKKSRCMFGKLVKRRGRGMKIRRRRGKKK